MRKPARRFAIGTIAAASAALILASPAVAHVKVSGTDATQGGFGVLTFRVPTESATASTTDLLVTLPDDHPIISVTAQDKPGWVATVTHKKLAAPQKDDDGREVSDYVATVEWKAATPQAGIPPNLFDTFSISAGPLPKESSISLPAAQTYSDGTVVNWNETSVQGQPEPDHPAPVLVLTAAGANSTGAVGSAQAGTAAPSGQASSSPSWLAVTALVVASVGVLLGLANLALLRRKS